MRSKVVHALVTVVVGGAALASVAAAPAAAATASRAHVNSTVTVTRIYTSPNGAVFSGELHACANFTYDTIVNGRYHALEYDGWISTDKAGSGWC